MCKNLRKIDSTSSFEKPVSMGAVGFWKLSYDCTSGYLDSLKLRIELKNTNGFRIITKRFDQSNFKTTFLNIT
jgi:hypothetical protein